ncbi:permease prefix domain 1-containing protein [Microbacterium luticocti]|uniref:permease prefix domain 1-containing protein n=1 Tax=Microbacterium luticocti TaxID=451764 RepID=UPI000405971A|nr:permease prefix domain 1-containing protein [Microbacterium luticocti]
MDAATLTDRYVAAAMRTVPEKQRGDLAAELAASIADQVEARTDAGEPADAAERAVLTELGDPERLAAGYTGRQLHLIGPRYYLDWWRLLKLLLWIVIPCVGAGVALGKVLSGAPVGDVIASVWVAMLTAGLHVAFWTTLVFVVLERTGHETMDATPWTPDKLPEPKQTGATFGDMVATIVMLLIFAGVILWDLKFGFVPGHRVSLIDPALWPIAIGILFALMALQAALVVAVHVRGRWTMRFAAYHTVLALAVVGVLVYENGHILNPAFFEVVAADDAANVQRILTVIFWFCVAGIAVWGIIDAFVKARRSRAVG